MVGMVGGNEHVHHEGVDLFCVLRMGDVHVHFFHFYYRVRVTYLIGCGSSKSIKPP